MTDYTELRRLAEKAAAARSRGTFGLYDFEAYVRVCEPETVIELVDTIDAFAAAQMKAGDNAATLHAEIERLEIEAELFLPIISSLEAERDEARAAVKMLADPVVQKIIEGGE